LIIRTQTPPSSKIPSAVVHSTLQYIINMSDEWNSVTKIGKSVNSGGAGPKEKVVRSEKEVAAARRAGQAVSTEKKFETGNKVRLLS
jgi:hypothetical protein